MLITRRLLIVGAGALLATSCATPIEGALPAPQPGRVTHLRVVVWQDDDDDRGSRAYAERLAREPATLAFEATSAPQVAETLKAHVSAAFCVESLVLVGHGNAGVLRLGAPDAETRGPTRVGWGGDRVTPAAFGRSVAPVLCENGATIYLFTCSILERITFGQELATASGATVIGPDGLLFSSGGSPHVGTAPLWVVTPDGTAFRGPPLPADGAIDDPPAPTSE